VIKPKPTPKPELTAAERKSLNRMIESYQQATLALQMELDLLAAQKREQYDRAPNQWQREPEGAAVLQWIERLRSWSEELNPDIPEIDLKAL
jgi:hypothetical protein